MSTSYPLHKIKVVLFESIHERGAEIFHKAGYTVERYDVAFAGDELVEKIADAHIIGIRSKTKVTADVLARAPRLMGIGCFCIGTNQVDLAAAAAAGVPVFNEAFSNTRSVAEKVIAEIIVLHRKLFQRSSEMHQGLWKKSAIGSHEIRGRTLGIIGYGRIGSQVSVLAEGMGMKVRYHDIGEVLPMGNADGAESLNDLLANSDVVTLHVPATTETRMMMGAEQLAQMKRGAYLINNARGNVVDIDALKTALLEGRLAGAAVDVFPAEPASNAEPFVSPLAGLDNVILSPHIGGSTVEAQRNIAESVGTRLTRFMNVGDTRTAVNVPEVGLPVLHDGCHRILHYHRNVPGVLGELHSALAGLGVNIVAEYLQTDPKHAYAIVDIEAPSGAGKESDTDLRASLKTPATIRVRTLW